MMIILLSCLPGCLLILQLDLTLLHFTLQYLYLGKGSQGPSRLFKATRPEKARTEELQLRLQRQ